MIRSNITYGNNILEQITDLTNIFFAAPPRCSQTSCCPPLGAPNLVRRFAQNFQVCVYILLIFPPWGEIIRGWPENFRRWKINSVGVNFLNFYVENRGNYAFLQCIIYFPPYFVPNWAYFPLLPQNFPTFVQNTPYG